MRTLIITSSIICLCALHSNAQSISPSTLNAAGGSGKISTNTYEWSVGEMTLVHTVSASNIVVTQGILQPIPASNSVKNATLLTNYIKVYPNPASETIYIDCSFPERGNLSYMLQDITGKIITSGDAHIEAGNRKIEINLFDIAVATYMLNISYQPVNAPAEKISFKIDKH